MGDGDVKEDVVGSRGAFEAWLRFSPSVDAFFEGTDVIGGVSASSCEDFQANDPSSISLFSEN